MAQKIFNIKLKYGFAGLILGIVTGIILIIITINYIGYSVSINSIILLSRESPIFIVLFLSPVFILTFLGYLAAIPYHNLIQKKNETKQIVHERFEKIYKYVEIIRKGDKIEQTEFLGEEDKIGNSILNLQNEIQKSKENVEIRQIEDLHRQWTAEGLALFGAVLREYNESIEMLANKVVSELVKYIDVKQAGFYYIDTDKNNEKIIKEIANFAYDRKRLSDNVIKQGEGLIGACIQEKKTNYLKSVSENYFKIESGLGSAYPKSVLIVPIMTQEGVIHGALELASFKVYDEFEVKFIEQIAESIATTISTLKINAETTRLLEESKLQALAKTEQEEELRKTISDMRRLQENADIQSVEFRAYQDSTNKSLIRAEYSIDGNLLFANKKFIDLFGYKSNSEIHNEPITKFINPDEPKWFQNLIIDIQNNKHFEGLLQHFTKNGKDLWIYSSYIGLKNDKGISEKVLFLGFDSTELKLQSENLNLKLRTINQSLLKIEINQEFNIIEINDNFISFLNKNKEEFINKHLNEIIHPDDQLNFKTIIENSINSGQQFIGEISIISPEKEKLWLYCNTIVIKDKNNNINSILFSAFDYTEAHKSFNKITESEKIINKQEEDIENLRERTAKRIDRVKDEVKDLYIEIETDNIFYENMLKSFPDAVISINNDNQLEYLNDRAIQILSIKTQNYKGKPLNDFIPVDPKTDGMYLGTVFNYENKELPIGSKKSVFILDKEGKPVYYSMTMTESFVGLRKRLSVFLSNR